MPDKDLVIYERGKIIKRLPPEEAEILQLVLLDDLSVTLREIEKHEAEVEKSLEREHFEGKIKEFNLSVTASPKVLKLLKEDPYTALATASFYNDGAKSAFVAINGAWEWKEVKSGEGYDVDFLKADRRIELIYYKCNAGETTTVRVVGKY